VLLDTCVLYPTVLRALLIGCARQGLFVPLWSPRILREWRHVAERRGEADLVEGEIALLGAAGVGECIDPPALLEDRVWSPDAADRHVIAAACAGAARLIVTLNVRDFPREALAPHELEARHPDPFLCALSAQAPDAVAACAEMVCARAQTLSDEPQPVRALMKRARLPRLGKLLERG
jgi:hypothetical protein